MKTADVIPWLLAGALIWLLSATVVAKGQQLDRMQEMVKVMEPVPRDSFGVLHLGPYRCRESCEGHLSGWRWAQSKGVVREADCDNPSRSFAEGCHLYLEATGRADALY